MFNDHSPATWLTSRSQGSTGTPAAPCLREGCELLLVVAARIPAFEYSTLPRTEPSCARGITKQWAKASRVDAVETIKANATHKRRTRSHINEKKKLDGAPEDRKIEIYSAPPTRENHAARGIMKQLVGDHGDTHE